METTNNCFTVSVPDILFALWPIQPYACIVYRHICTPFPPEQVQAKPAHFFHLYRYRQNLHTFPTCTGTGKTCTLFPPAHIQENPARFSHLYTYRQNLHVCVPIFPTAKKVIYDCQGCTENTAWLTLHVKTQASNVLTICWYICKIWSLSDAYSVQY